MPDQISTRNHKKEKHSRHEFEVEVSPTKMGEYFEVAYRRLAPSVEIKGFRPGQAPKLMTIQKIGQDRYFQTTLDLALPASYGQALKQLGLRPVAPPEISIIGYGEGAPLTYRVSVDVIPEVDPGPYAKLHVKPPKPKTDVSEAEVGEVIERLRRQQATTRVVNRPAQTGDRVEIDYVGTVGHIKRDDLSSQHFPLILGDKVLPKSFEQVLSGKKAGETVEFDDTVGKDAVHFAVVIHGVAEVTLPDVDAAFAARFGRKGATDLQQAIRGQLETEKGHEARHQLESAVLDAVAKKAKLEVPRSLVEEELSRRIKGLKEQLGQLFGKFLEQQKKTEADLRKEFEPEAIKSVTVGLLLGEIAKREGFGADRGKDESDEAFQRKVVRRTIDFLVASATSRVESSK